MLSAKTQRRFCIRPGGLEKLPWRRDAKNVLKMEKKRGAEKEGREKGEEEEDWASCLIPRLNHIAVELQEK